MSDTGSFGHPDEGDPDVAQDPRRVPDTTLERIFQSHVAFDLTTPELDDPAKLPVEQGSPELVLLVAQPGAHASAAIGAIRRDFDDQGSLITVRVDDFRRYHPDYETIRDWSPEYLDEATEPAATWFADRAATYLRERGFNVLIEDTDPDRVMQTAEAYAASGHQVRLAALAVPAVQSRLSLVETFLTYAEHFGTGPWTTVQAHDAAYDATAEIVRRAEASPAVRRITINSWYGPIHDAERAIGTGHWETFGPDGWVPIDQTAHDALIEAREDAPSPVQRRALANGLATMLDRVQRLDPRHLPDLVDMTVEIRRDLQLGAGKVVVRNLDFSLEYLNEALGDLRTANQALDATDAASEPRGPDEPLADPGPRLVDPGPPLIDPGPDPDPGPDIGGP